jgi:hydrogenase maturation protein HypF
LEEVADIFVLHDRPIARACDDSVVRMADRPHIMRRARGYAPLPIRVPHDLQPVLAVGGHLKSTVAIGFGRQVWLSQHIGDLDSPEARDTFERTIDDLCKLYRFKPELIVSDLHPEYASTRWAQRHAKIAGVPLVKIQHHQSHVAACAAENGLTAPYLGVAWDGAGVGLDGTIWGGEFFVSDRNHFERVASLRQFALPGGEGAMRDCSRPAAGVLWQTLGSMKARRWIRAEIAAMLDYEINAPASSSVGRLFDAVAYLAGAAQRNLFEGQAAMCLEGAIGRTQTNQAYEIAFAKGVGDWSALVEGVQSDRAKGVALGTISAKFHNALVNWIVAVARTTKTRNVVLSGGVFQNAYLSRRSRQLLEADGFEVFTHQQVPANDGGLALGQAVLAAAFD